MSKLLNLEQKTLKIKPSEKLKIIFSLQKVENTEKKLENLEYENSFTEENVLNDIESFNDIYKENEDKKDDN